MIEAIEPRQDSIVLSATIDNPGDRDISLNRARSFVLDEGDHAVHHLNPPFDNPELRVAGHTRLSGRLVFIGPPGPSTRQMMLSTNEGIGTADNPYDNSPVLKASLPVAAPGETDAVSQAAHANGSVLRIDRVTVNEAGCLVALLATNGNDRAILLNHRDSLALTDRGGATAPVQPPLDNPELVVPPGDRLDAVLVFPCGRLDTAGGLQLSSNRGAGGTIDNPYDTLPIFALPVRAETAAGGGTLPQPHAAVSPIARSELTPVLFVAAGDTASGNTPAAQPPRRSPEPVAANPTEPGLPQARPLPAPAAASPPAENPAQLEAALHASRSDRGVRVVLSADELFGSSRDALDPGADAVLASLDALIAATHPREVDINGHTDSSGDDDDNLTMSEQRAHAVAAWLEQHSPKRHPRFVAKGYGRTRPVAPNHNPDGSDNPDDRARNRRIEILLRR